jgi:hypothetical protein
MPGELPFFIIGTVAGLSVQYRTAYVRVPNGNVYDIHPHTIGIDFSKLEKGVQVRLEVTTRLSRVLSASVIE